MSIAFAKCGCFRACHFVSYATSHFVTNLLSRVIIERYMKNQKVCEKVLNRKDNYDRHVRVCKAEFKCLYCDYTFKFSSHRTAHTYIEHRDKLFKCGNCSVEYFDEKKCQRHQQTCKVCYYIVLISISLFMNFKIYLPCLQAPASVPVNQMECSPPHLPPSL